MRSGPLVTLGLVLLFSVGGAGCGDPPEIVCGDLGSPCCGPTATRCMTGLVCLPEGGMEVCRQPPAPDAGTDAAVAPDAGMDAAVAPDTGMDAAVAPDTGMETRDVGTDAASGADASSLVGCSATCDGLVLPTPDLPTDGLVLWLRADRGVRADSDRRVCGWCDLSGRGNDVTTVTMGPLWARDALGGYPGIDFEGFGQTLRRMDVLGIPSASGRTMVIASELTDLSSRACPLAQYELGSDRAFVGIDPNTYATVGNRFGVYYGGNSFDSLSATDLFPHVHAFAVDTLETGLSVDGLGHYEIDGRAQTLVRTAGDGLLTDYSRAATTDVGCYAGHVVVSEVVVYDHPLDEAQRLAVSRALGARNGIAVSP